MILLTKVMIIKQFWSYLFTSGIKSHFYHLFRVYFIIDGAALLRALLLLFVCVSFKGIQTEVSEKLCWAEFLRSSGTVIDSTGYYSSCCLDNVGLDNSQTSL